MKILVTGGTGTVGRELVKVLLQREAEIRVPARNAPAKGVLPNSDGRTAGSRLRQAGYARCRQAVPPQCGCGR